MINLNNILKVFKKEIKLYVRDKSVIFTNLFIPFIVGPFYLMFMIEVTTQMIENENKSINDNTTFKISYQGIAPESLLKRFENNPKIKIVENSAKIEETKILDYRDKFKKYLETLKQEYSLTRNINQAIMQEESLDLYKYKNDVQSAKSEIEHAFDFTTTDVHLAFFNTQVGQIATYFFFSSESNKSKAAYIYVKKEIEKQRKDDYQQVLKENQNIAKSLPANYTFWEVDLLEPESKFFLIAGLMTSLSIFMILLTGIYMPTIKSTIGEKDAHTYKVFMMTPIAPNEIFLGKLLSITTQGIVILIPYIIQGIIFYALGEKSGAFTILNKLTLVSFLELASMILSIIMLCSSICFFVCSFSKTSNQAQSLLSLVMFGMLTPMILILINEGQLSSYNAIIPFYNLPLVIASMLKGTLTFGLYLTALASNFITAIFITLLSVNAFVVQWKGRDDSFTFSDLLSRKTKKGSLLTSAHAFFAFAIILIGSILSKFLNALEFKFLYYFSFPTVFMLGTCFIVISYTKIDIFKSIKWKSNTNSSIQIMIGGLFIALATAISFTNWLPEVVWIKEYYSLFDTHSWTGIIAIFLIFAVLPVICEEILFRGIIYQGLQMQYSSLTANIITCMMAASILIPVYQVIYIPIFYFGLNLIYAKYDLFNSMLVNIILRGSIILFALQKDIWKTWLQEHSLTSITAVIFCLGLGIKILNGKHKKYVECPLIQSANDDGPSTAA